jgi:hypothetical protein
MWACVLCMAGELACVSAVFGGFACRVHKCVQWGMGVFDLTGGTDRQPRGVGPSLCPPAETCECGLDLFLSRSRSDRGDRHLELKRDELK